MDSFRSLVNHDLWMGFLPAAGPDGLSLSSEEMAMARRRQHTAHEIGHSLGLAYNFMAATRDRSSVMDYPVPLVRLDEDGFEDLSEDDEPYVILNRRFAHVYLHHRTALIGAIKHIGGWAFSYALKRDGLESTRPVAAQDQRHALDEVLAALEPGELRIPDRVVDLMAPAPMGWDAGWGWHVDTGAMDSPGDTKFDPVDVAHRWAFEIVTRLLDPARMARAAALSNRESAFPSPHAIMDRLIDAGWEQFPASVADAHDRALVRAIQRSVVDALIDLAADERANAKVRAVAESHLRGLEEILAPRRGQRLEPVEQAHHQLLRRDVADHFNARDERGPRPTYIAVPWP